jgi:hypothetical protein
MSSLATTFSITFIAAEVLWEVLNLDFLSAGVNFFFKARKASLSVEIVTYFTISGDSMDSNVLVDC